MKPRVRDYHAEYLAQNHGEAVCPACGQTFVKRMVRVRYCSHSCATLTTGQTVRPRLLALLDDGEWHATREIALALYGCADVCEVRATHTLIWHARRRGHQIETGTRGRRQVAGYRLVREAS